MLYVLEAMKRHADAIMRLERKQCRQEECSCELEYDPYGTGDSNYAVYTCEDPDNCPREEKRQDLEEEE